MSTIQDVVAAAQVVSTARAELSQKQGTRDEALTTASTAQDALAAAEAEVATAELAVTAASSNLVATVIELEPEEE